MIKSYGKLIYDPPSHLGDPKRWLILACDDEISKYYRHLFYKDYPWLGKLTRPVFGAHISVVRGEDIPNIIFWNKYQNKIINFEYEPGVKDNGTYYWLSVKCKFLSDIRQELGLIKFPKFGFHLTIGRRS